MTVQAINTDKVEVEVDGEKLSVQLESTTELITKLLAARKDGYQKRREAKAKERQTALKRRRAKIDRDLAALTAA